MTNLHEMNSSASVECSLLCMSGLQLRNSEQDCFHDNFLISQPIPMMRPSLKSFQWVVHHRVWLRNKKVSIFKTLNFRPYLLPWLHNVVSPVLSSIHPLIFSNGQKTRSMHHFRRDKYTIEINECWHLSAAQKSTLNFID